MPSPMLASSAVARLARGEPRALVPIGGGRNSQVFRLDTANGQTFALKAYFRHPGDSRDRLGTEFGAFRFLWEHGVRAIPRPVAHDPEAALGLYEFIPGSRPEPPNRKDVEAACDFLVNLHHLGKRSEALTFPPASEACFSFEAIVNSIETRFLRLDSVDPEWARTSGLTAFLDLELRPAWRTLREECRQHHPRFEEVLPQGRRILSPSDVGFHNALRRSGSLVFLDFEYFGWDDPAKLLVDFLLHPGMALTLELRSQFAEGLLDRLQVEGLPSRARWAFPLFGIKWCLILLNEFLPGALDRRTFADLNTIPPRQRQIDQLSKTRIKLQQLLDDHAHFPYFHD